MSVNDEDGGESSVMFGENTVNGTQEKILLMIDHDNRISAAKIGDCIYTIHWYVADPAEDAFVESRANT